MCSDSPREVNVLSGSEADQVKQAGSRRAASDERGNAGAEATLKCRKCGKVFRGKEELEVHKRINHHSKNEQNREIVYLWQNISGW